MLSPDRPGRGPVSGPARPEGSSPARARPRPLERVAVLDHLETRSGVVEFIAGGKPPLALVEVPRTGLACCHEQSELFEAALARAVDGGTVQVTSEPGTPEVAPDEEVGDVGKCWVFDWVRRACRWKDGDLADEFLVRFSDQAPHLLIGERLAEMVDDCVERRSRPARRGEGRVVLNALDHASGEAVNVVGSRPTEVDLAHRGSAPLNGRGAK